MNKQEMIKAGCLVIDQIDDGFLQCNHDIISGTEEEIYEFLCEKIALNGWEHSYVDFYYGTLSQEIQKKVREVLPKHLQNLIDQYEKVSDIYFPLSEELLELTHYLSIHEHLFSTYYFNSPVCTIWANYQKTYVVFTPRDMN